MNEQIKNNGEELSDVVMDTVTGGANINGYEVPNYYVHCEYDTEQYESLTALEFCACLCRLNGTSDCIQGYCNPSASK